MLKILAAVGSSLVLSLAAVPTGRAGPATKVHVQKVALTILPGDRIVEPNLALAPGLPVRMTVTNATHEFHTFTVPALGISRLILPADNHGARKTTFTFNTNRWGSVAWYCVICPSGMHGKAHTMGGTLYPIINPSALP
jgi:heme/copper-type cytochrome/quinol oxidase subunit 2